MITSLEVKIFIAEEIAEIKRRSMKHDCGFGNLFYDEDATPFNEEELYQKLNAAHGGTGGTIGTAKSMGLTENDYYSSNANKNPFGHGMDKEEEAKSSGVKTIANFSAEEIVEMEARYS